MFLDQKASARRVLTLRRIEMETKKQIHVLAYYNKIIKLKDTMYTKKKSTKCKGIYEIRASCKGRIYF